MSYFFQRDPAGRVFISVLPLSRRIPLMRWEPVDRAIRDTLAEVLAGRQQPAAALKDLSARLADLSAAPPHTPHTPHTRDPRVHSNAAVN